MFKYEGFEKGQKIRAFDFEPRAGRGPCFVEGHIFQVSPNGTNDLGYAHYAITVTRDVWDGKDKTGMNSRISATVFVPMESSMDWDGRVVLAERNHPKQVRS